MRRFFAALAILLLLGGLAAGAWLYLHPTQLTGQFAGYRVGAAATYSLAKREIAGFDSGSDRKAKDRELVAGWGTGNRQFDLYLAKYLSEPECSDDLRQAFSLELGWREELLARWAHYWAWRAKQDPAAEADSVVEYLAALAKASPPRLLTWREVLDVQAVFTLLGRGDLAHRLSPENWRSRWDEFSLAKREQTEIKRPALPLPE
jgi:hypothetical protein